MTQNMMMEVHSSHLALRFYARAGWTEGALKSCLARGGLKYHGDPNASIQSARDVLGGPSASYWTLQQGGSFDVESLLAVAGPVHDYHGNVLLGGDAKAYVTEMNW